jgi:hypothetical protein
VSRFPDVSYFSRRTTSTAGTPKRFRQFASGCERPQFQETTAEIATMSAQNKPRKWIWH